MSVSDIYQSKLMAPGAAVQELNAGAQVAMGMATAEPPALLAAIASHVEKAAIGDIKLWYFHSMDHAGKTVLRPDMLEHIRPRCMFLSPIERQLLKIESIAKDTIEFVPVAFSDSPRLLSEKVPLDMFVTTVSPMDEHGWFTFGTSNDYSTAAARSAKRLIVEVNPNMPRVFGESLLHISEVDGIVENEAPLAEVNLSRTSTEEKIVAEMIAGMIDDHACLQMGIGSLPSAVCSQLKDRKDLGIHTELLTPALASLVECGAVTNQSKTTYKGRSVFTFAMGNRDFYEFLDDNPAMHSAPVNIVNDPRHIAKNDNVVSVNATLQIDLSGACNSEHLMGRQYSGSGGQLDFVRGATASKGGKSIIACQSTACDGTVSRIVPKLNGPVTTPRNDTHIVMTEYGWADLKGKTVNQRTDALIGLAHPQFRDELSSQL